MSARPPSGPANFVRGAAFRGFPYCCEVNIPTQPSHTAETKLGQLRALVSQAALFEAIGTMLPRGFFLYILILRISTGSFSSS